MYLFVSWKRAVKIRLRIIRSLTSSITTSVLQILEANRVKLTLMCICLLLSYLHFASEALYV